VKKFELSHHPFLLTTIARKAFRSAPMTKTKSSLLLAVSCTAFVGAAHAHHGFGSFDLTKDLEVSGVVAKIDFVNPHSWLYLTVVDPSGQEANWRCEMRAATVLKRSGWSPEMFPQGQRVTITGSPDRNDPRSCYLSTVTWPDGTSMNRYGQREKSELVARTTRELRLPSGELNISGDWAPEQVVMSDPRGREGGMVPLSKAGEAAAGALPPGTVPIPGARNAPSPAQGQAAPRAFGNQIELTDAGRAAMEGLDMRKPENNPRFRCETTSIIFDWTFDGPVNRIAQEGDTTTLRYGQLGFTRTIYMDAEHPASVAPSRSGHSTGRWENDVLIVDTVGFAPGIFNGFTPHSDRLHVVEKFSLDPQRMALTRAWTADDADYFVSQVSGSDTVLVADVPYSPDECKELTFVDYSSEGARTGNESAKPAPATPVAKPWWKFWD
jgi:hypothetical protein